MSRFNLFQPRPANYDAEADAAEILAAAIEEHNPSHVFAGFSGGHDSLCAAHVASMHPRFSGCVHINTGIGIEETREFVRETCRTFGWPLKEYHPPVAYEDIVREHGFPGPYGHRFMYTRLKERAIAEFTREHKQDRRGRVMLVTGVRLAESRRRMGAIGPVNRDGALVWVAPIIEWEHHDKHAYMERHQLPRNRVVDLLCMSGECLCGAFAKPNELEEIALWFPEVATRLRGLEQEVRCAGVAACRWGERPPETQETDPQQSAMSLCWSCDMKAGTEAA